MPETGTRTFSYSVASIATSKQRMRALLLAAAIVAWPVTVSNTRAGSISLGTFLFIILPLAYVQFAWMSTHWRRMRLHVRQDGLLRESGTIRQILPWTGITRVRIRRNPRREPRAIELYPVSQRPIVIAGFEQMAEIARLIEAGVPRSVTVETKHARVDLDHPAVLFGFTVVIGVTLVVLLSRADRVLRENIGGTMQIGMGLLLLLYTPISRQNPSFRIMEVVLAVLMIGLALFRLVGARA